MNRPVHLLIWAPSLRGIGDGFDAVFLPVCLTRLEPSPFEIGTLVGTALLAFAAFILAFDLVDTRYDARHILIVAPDEC